MRNTPVSLTRSRVPAWAAGEARRATWEASARAAARISRRRISRAFLAVGRSRVGRSRSPGGSPATIAQVRGAAARGVARPKLSGRLAKALASPLALTKPPPHALFPPPHPQPLNRPRIGRKPSCIATVPTPAARFAKAMSGRPCGSPAGATASATTVGCCSSICATTTASPRSWPIRTARPSSWPRRCARSGWCASTARSGSVPRAPSTRSCPPGRSRSISTRSRCWARRPNCRCRCSASRTIRRTSGSSTASSICAARSCMPTSCCADA